MNTSCSLNIQSLQIKLNSLSDIELIAAPNITQSLSSETVENESQFSLAQVRLLNAHFWPESADCSFTLYLVATVIYTEDEIKDKAAALL